MKWFDGYRMRLMFVGFVVAIVLGGGNVKADFIMSEPTNVGPPINDSMDVQECDFSADGLELYIAGGGNIRVATRETIESDWGEPVSISIGGVEPAISPDGLELYFRFWGQWDLYVTTRPSKDDPWSSPVRVGPPVGSNEPNPPEGSNDVWEPDISADGLSLYFCSTRVGGYGGGDIWVATRTTIENKWGEPVNLGPNVNGSGDENGPSLSGDGLALVYYRSGWRFMVTTRESIHHEWRTPVDLGLNLSGYYYGPELSPDGSTLYFDASSASGGYGNDDIWQVKFTPIVDFDGDRKVDIADLQIMVDHWGENYPLCDIAPMPWGNGIVDVQDLVVLTEHFSEDYRFVAHWKLDETDGDIAYDSVGNHDGTINGNPFWQPTGGMIGGTLLFDGIDDYVETPFILDPAKGSLSVFAWIKGWTPGQVIISQRNTTGNRGAIPGSTWLGIDPSGKLMTGFSDTYFGALESESVITDMQWHHISFVYDLDTLHRRLYVDGVQVAEDATVVSGVPSDGGLYIGASKDLDATSFFSGMIDDVRIYDVALTAEEIAALAQ